MVAQAPPLQVCAHARFLKRQLTMVVRWLRRQSYILPATTTRIMVGLQGGLLSCQKIHPLPCLFSSHAMQQSCWLKVRIFYALPRWFVAIKTKHKQIIRDSANNSVGQKGTGGQPSAGTFAVLPEGISYSRRFHRSTRCLVTMRNKDPKRRLQRVVLLKLLCSQVSKHIASCS